MSARHISFDTWSDNSKVDHAIDFLIDEFKPLPSFGPITSKRRKALRLVVLELYLRHLEEPLGWLSYSRNKSDYSIPTRYNPIGIGYRPLISVIDGLIALGYIDNHMGYHSHTGAKSKSRYSRMRAKKPLIDILTRAHSVNGSMIDIHRNTEVVELRNPKKRPVDYRDTRKTKRMRSVVKKYNKFLRSQHINVDLARYPDSIRINLGNKFIRRIFNNSSFKEGGRFYGGWWQSVPKAIRTRILIGMKDTVELDFSGMQVVLIYAVEGIDYFATGLGDPYTLPGYAAGDRDLFKKCLLAAVNATSKRAAMSAVQKGVNQGKLTLPIGCKVSDVLADFESHHSPIIKHFYSGRATHFQYLDSQVAEQIIRHMTEVEHKPVLTIHDSFIVEASHASILRKIMLNALETVITKETPLKSISPMIKTEAFWINPARDALLTSTRDSDWLQKIVNDPLRRRQIEWLTTKRQGVVIYEPN